MLYYFTQKQIWTKITFYFLTCFIGIIFLCRVSCPSPSVSTSRFVILITPSSFSLLSRFVFVDFCVSGVLTAVLVNEIDDEFCVDMIE